MAKKSKTQRAKASARRAEKREVAEELLNQAEELEQDTESDAKASKKLNEPALKKEKVLSKTESSEPAKKTAVKEPGRIRTFINGVRSEMKRVTWPTRLDVIRWSGVVVAALIFFGLYVFVLDNYIVTPILLAISSLGA